MSNQTGIYIIKNLLNNHIYIGSAQRSFKIRFTQHYSDLKLNKHRNIHLQRAFNKYGETNFVFIILETVEPSKCIEIEQFYMNNLKPEYNINPIASSVAGRKMTPEQLIAHSNMLRGRPAWNKGIPFGEESRKKMSLAKKGRPGNNKGVKLRKYRLIQRNDGKIYNCITDAAEDLNVKENTIIKACTDKNKQRRVRGFILNYI